MEIMDYLGAIRRRLALLLLIPLLAGLAAAAYVLLSPAQYTSQATVNGGTLVGDGTPFSGTQANAQFASAFAQTAKSPQVLAGVSKATRESAATLADNLKVAQAGESSSMTLGYTSTKKDAVVPVLQQASAQTLGQMFGPRAGNAKARMSSAQKAVETANKRVAAYAEKAGVADPRSYYTSQLSRLNSLLQQQASLRAQGSTTSASSLQPAIDATRKDLARFDTLLPGYDAVRAEQNAATTELANARGEYQRATAVQNAAKGSSVTFVNPVSEVSKTGKLLTLVIPAIAAGLFLAVLLALALEMLGGARRTRTDEDTDTDLARTGRRGRHSEQVTVPEASTRSTVTTSAVGRGGATAEGTSARHDARRD